MNLYEMVKAGGRVVDTIRTALETNNIDGLVECWEQLEDEYQTIKNGGTWEGKEGQAELRKEPEARDFATFRTQLSSVSKELFGHGCKIVDGELVKTETRNKGKKEGGEGEETEPSIEPSGSPFLTAAARFNAEPTDENYAAMLMIADSMKLKQAVVVRL